MHKKFDEYLNHVRNFADSLQIMESRRVKCPLAISQKKCKIIQRPGSVRDFPHVEIFECLSCGITFHGSDLSLKVNYEEGTMNTNPSEFGIALPVPDGDDKRRGTFLRNLHPTNRKNIRVLDFGSGKGNLLTELKGEFNIAGVEIDAAARKFTIGNGFEVYDSLESVEISNKKFDVITMIHVIEHLYEPVQVLKRLSKLLDKNGIIVIETPNADDALLVSYKCQEFQNWTYWSHHPILYNYNGVHNLLRSSSLQLNSIESVQRYGLANHLYWLIEGKPGGHIYWNGKIPIDLENRYRDKLFQDKRNDTIFIQVSL